MGPSSSAESALSWLWSGISQWLAFFRGLTLAAGSAASGAVAAAGFGLLLLLALAISLAPANDTFSRALTLDFAQSDLVGEAVFLPEAQTTDGLLPDGLPRDVRCVACTWVWWRWPQQAHLSSMLVGFDHEL